MKKIKPSVIDKFVALPHSGKARVARAIGAESSDARLARSRPLNARERQQWRRFQTKAKTGRPKVGKGAKTISLTVERELLKRADAYAKRHGLTRAKLVAQSLQATLGSAA